MDRGSEDEVTILAMILGSLWMPGGRHSLVAPLLMSLIRVRIEAGMAMDNCDGLDTGTISNKGLYTVEDTLNAMEKQQYSMQFLCIPTECCVVRTTSYR